MALAAAFSILTLAPAATWALGLGRLTVQSALGEPLRAEIDITSITPDEAASLQARVAPPETYRAAGVDYNPVLGVTTIALQRRPDGRPYLRVSSERTVTEPFVDAILDLSWSSGRLVREYTLLFDPPAPRTATAPTPAVTEVPATRPLTPPPPAPAAAPVAAPAASVAARPPKADTAPAPAAAAAPKPAASVAAPAPRPVRPADEVKLAKDTQGAKEAKEAKDADRTVKVRSGDTLGAIAQRNLVQGVSLDQMIVGLYRANPDAFSGKNMNRLRSGAVLDVPSADQANAVSRAEARQIIVAQSADFAAFRQRLASGVSESAAPQSRQQASGKVEAEVQDRRQGATPAPDKLTLSKGGVAGGAGAEDRLAKARAQQDDKARAAELSRNLDELRRLKEAASKPVAGKVAATTPAPAASAPTKPVAPAPAKPAAPVASAPVPAKPAAPAASAPAPVKPAPAASVASAPVVAMPAPVAASAASAPASAASAVASAASGAATGVADAASAPASRASRAPITIPMQPPIEEPSFLDSLNLPLLGGAGALLAAVAGLGLYLRSRRKPDSAETSFLESRLQPDSFFGASGGQRVDTRDATGGPSSMSYSLSQLDAIGDVDPVAEADVYLAYGRDLQAEEILKEALRVTPDRLAIRTKLAEVYAKRRDTKGFEQIALQVHEASGGSGDDWARVQEMGLSIDPENPLYQPGGQPMSAPAAQAPRAEPLGASTMPLSEMPSIQPSVSAEPEVPAVPSGLDLDISALSDAIAPTAEPVVDLPPLDMPEAPAPQASAMPDLSLDFDTPAPAAPAVAADPALQFDLSDISLDLGGSAPPAASSSPAGLGADAAAELPALETPEDPLARKLELADEFRHIGDIDGARELLEEVIANADGPTRAKAQAMLDNLA